MVPDGQMHIAQLTESEIDRSIGKSDLKVRNARQDNIFSPCLISSSTNMFYNKHFEEFSEAAQVKYL